MTTRKQQAKERLVFLSHTTADAPSARQLQEWLRKTLIVEVFLSSDIESIELGEDWYEGIISALKNCAVGLILVTQNSVARPWVHFELGGLKLGRKTAIPVLGGTIRAEDLLPPLDRSQACHYATREGRLKLLQDISNILHLPVERAHLESNAANAPKLEIQEPPQPPPIRQQQGHGIALERLFETSDRWTTIVYTCRATFTKEQCPAEVAQPLLRKTLPTHIPVDELQTACVAINHFLPTEERENENDIPFTVVCSKQAEKMARQSDIVPGEAPHILDRDLIVIGENNFSNFLLHLMEPYLPWTKNIRWEREHPEKPDRPMVYVQMTPWARDPDQRHIIGDGGGMISVFPSPLTLGKRVLSLFGCHRDGQFSLESWMRGSEVDEAVQSIAARLGTRDPKVFAVQIVIDRSGAPLPHGVVETNPHSVSIGNRQQQGEHFWLTQLTGERSGDPLQPNPECLTAAEMYDISLLALIDRTAQKELKQQILSALPRANFYWEDEHCEVGFHITLYEFCTHKLPSRELVSELEQTARELSRLLEQRRSAEQPQAMRAQVRGIELAQSALISYVDFLPEDARQSNLLQRIRTWCEDASRRVHDPSLLNRMYVPYPTHVTLCRFQRPIDGGLGERLQKTVRGMRHSRLHSIDITKVALVVARKQPYREVEVRAEIDLEIE